MMLRYKARDISTLEDDEFKDLLSCSNFEASDERDKIYAFLALANADYRITAGYRRDIRSVPLEMTKEIILVKGKSYEDIKAAQLKCDAKEAAVAKGQPGWKRKGSAEVAA